MQFFHALAGSILLSTMTLAAPQPTTSADVFPFEIQRETLDNGLTVLMVPMPSEGLVSYWSVVRTGARDEVEQGVTGFAHFFEHMMFKGSENFPGDGFDRIVNSIGASSNAYTTDDYTAYHMSFTTSDLPQVIELESDRFQRLMYDESVFRTEAGAVYGEYRKNRASPWYQLFEAIHNHAFDAHTYKHLTIGFEADIKEMPERFEYSKSFFQRFYRPENVVLLVAGDFDTKETLSSIEKYYGGWERGYETPAVKPEPEQTAQRRIVVPYDGQTLPWLTLNFKGAAFAPEDVTTVAATLIPELAFGETSALYKKLVLDEQRVDFLVGDFGDTRDPGLWSVMTRVKNPEDLRAIEAEIWNTVADLHAEAVTPERLADVASRMKYGFLSSLSTPDGLASNLARMIAHTGGITAVNTLYTTLDKVTPEDVRRAAQMYLTAERCTIGILHTGTETPLSVWSEEMGTAADVVADAGVVSADAQVTMQVRDPNIAFNIWFKVGSQDDPAGREGLADLTATLISEGATKRLAYDKILEQLFPLAASYGLSVDKEMTVARGQVHGDKLDDFVGLFVEALLMPGFRAEDFERLRDRSISYIENTLRFASDEELGKAALYGQVFDGTPYGHLTAGTIASLKAITLDDVKAFYKEHYNRDNVVIGLGGGYPDGLPERLAKELGKLPAGTPTMTSAPQPNPIEGRQVLMVEKPGPSTAISFGYPIDLHRGSREFYAMWIANSWLGEHRNSASHLYQVIRKERGMNYGDYSYIEAFTNGGRRTMPPTGVGRRQQLFEVWIRPVPREQAAFALRAALREVEALAKNGMSLEEFERRKSFLKKYSLHFAETTAARLGYAVDDRYYGTDAHLATFGRMMDEITLDEVNAAVAKYLQVDDMVIALVTEDAEGLAKQLISDEASPIDYGETEKPTEVLVEDKEIERYPLNILPENVTIVPVEEMFEGAVIREASSPR
jgi:zinc protease